MRMRGYLRMQAPAPWMVIACYHVGCDPFSETARARRRWRRGGKDLQIPDPKGDKRRSQSHISQEGIPVSHFRKHKPGPICQKILVVRLGRKPEKHGQIPTQITCYHHYSRRPRPHSHSRLVLVIFVDTSLQRLVELSWRDWEAGLAE